MPHESAYPIADFIADIGDIEHSVDAMTIRRKSRDRYAVSPMLRKSLEGKYADVVVSPADKAEVIKVVAAAVKHRVPITARGGGTANYGQSVPLRGGILLDMTRLAGVVWARPGAIRALAGTIVADMNIAAREIGWELRMHPTTNATATIAGFVAGGTGGVGSVIWGVLRDRGNITGIEVVTAEDTPRIVELRGKDTALIHHAYGANSIILEVEMPLTPAIEWRETIVAFPTYMQAVRCGVSLGQTVGIVKNLLSVHEWPTPKLMPAIKGLVPDGHSMMSSYVAMSSCEDFDEVVAEFGGIIVSACAEGQGVYKIPLYEMAFGHALAQIQRTDNRYTAIEGFFHDDDIAGLVERVHDKLKGVGPMRLELRRWGSKLAGSGSPYILFESEEQLTEIAAIMKAEGAGVANSHASNVRSVGKKDITEEDLAFKRASDPYNLLNPGRFELDSSADVGGGFDLAIDNWFVRRTAV
jgi:hypothetical protein